MSGEWFDVDGLCPPEVRDEIAVLALQVAGGFEWDRDRAKYLLLSIDRLIEAMQEHLVDTIGPERADRAGDHLQALVWAVTGYVDLAGALAERTQGG
ncbi:MAG TPA: hypothetical protein VIR58_08930 [Acidimicrobiales bacterium]